MMENIENVIEVLSGPVPFVEQSFHLLNGTMGDEWVWQTWLRADKGQVDNLIERCRVNWDEKRACYLKTDADKLPFAPEILQGLGLTSKVYLPILAIGKEKVPDEFGFLYTALKLRVNLGFIKLDE